ncbi:MAG: DUF5714 domain-containing protein [Cloacibacillus sp.]
MALNCERSFEIITERCMRYYKTEESGSILEIVFDVMNDVSFPMHNFAHHYLVPAVLLSSLYIAKKENEEKFQNDLHEVEKRAKNVLPAFCGFYGTCGAAVGCGIYMSVATGTTPLSKETWGLCNRATAGALTRMAELGGPRCCKRNTFAALQFMKKYTADNLGYELAVPETITCVYGKFNNECLKNNCPYFNEEKEETR